MSPRRTRRGTVRESINESINSMLSTSKKVRSSRRINKSQITKSSEEESDNTAEINNVTDVITTTNILDDTSANTRKQRRKILLTTVEDSAKPQAKKSRNNKSQRLEKHQNTETELSNINLLISEDESFNENNDKDVRQSPYTTDTLISEDEEIPQKITRSRKKDKLSCGTQRKNLKIVEKTKNETSSSKNVTPKTSPLKLLNISLTPHRSKKTPRKSPVNLGSPKTHSRNSLEVLNVPRKLPLVDSPTSSEQSNSSLQQSSYNTKNNFVENTGSKRKNIKSRSSMTKKSISPKPRFSKSPKIVFKSPKSKSPKTNKKSSLKKLSKISPKKSETLLSDNLLLKSENTFNTSKSQEMDKTNSLVESNEFCKITSPIEYRKSQSSQELQKSLTEERSFNEKSIDLSLKSKNSSKSTTPTQSKKSSKTISPQISRKMPKIVLTLKSKKTPVKTSKSQSPSKLKKSPAKTSKTLSSSASKKPPQKISKSQSPSKSKISPVKTPKNLSQTKTSKPSKTVSPSKVERSSIKLPVRKSIASNDIVNSSSMSPRVVVNKLSPQLHNSSLTSQTSQPSVNLIPVDHLTQSIVASKGKEITLKDNKSPKSRSSLTKRQSTVKNAIPAQILKNQIMTTKKSNEANLSFNVSTPSYSKKGSSILKPTVTSTPRDKLMHKSSSASNKKDILLNKSKSFSLLEKSQVSKSKASKRLDNQNITAQNLQLLENESEPSFNDSSLIHMSDVFDSDTSQKNNTFEISKNSSSDSINKKVARGKNTSQKINKSDTFEIKKDSSTRSTRGNSKKDDTYEVEHPKTPRFQNKSRKRTADEAELGTEEDKERKRNCKVHFVSPSLSIQSSSGITRVGTPGHAIQQKRTPISLRKTKTPVRQSLMDKMENKKNLLSQTKMIANTPVNKRRSISLPNSSVKYQRSNNEQTASVNRLSKPKSVAISEKKSGLKTPATTKIPNFAEIHKKNFAKMESLVDLKKRIEKRHVLNSVSSSTKKKHIETHESGKDKPNPSDLTNGAYNRFGFKIRKSDAINIISKKQSGSKDSREKKREDARSALKGVRMNRRFELQMKSRIKNS